MALEIEWKFLVTRYPGPPSAGGTSIEQGYLDADARPSVRVRLRDGNGTLNIKQTVDDAPGRGPLVCHEYEYPIPADDARGLLALARERIAKTRYVLPSGIELDVFEGAFAGLVIAELEVPEVGAPPRPPDGWEWRDVSSDLRYTNRALAAHGLPDDAAFAVVAD